MNRMTSASPRFIAQFRPEDPQIVNTEVPEISCAICLQQLELGEHYSQWPCTAQHTFHYECILCTLRKQNQCPLCRHPVEVAHLFPIDCFQNLVIKNEFI